MNIDDLTIKQARELTRLFASSALPLVGASMPSHPFQVGEKYFIRTVTHHYTGVLLEVHLGELVLEQAAWIADSGRFHQAVTTGSFEEVEPYGPDQLVIIGRGAIVDACVVKTVPTSQK